mmetsp:Transcript_30749/g.57613  ORF Transcript_30749/g.57613 Transcript_30749/m.57613 type:complete len:130 (-) Transcript_30749:289-678(-)
MGHRACPACPAGKDDDFEYEDPVKRVFGAVSVDRDMIMAMQGGWYCRASGRRVGELDGTKFIWDARVSGPTPVISTLGFAHSGAVQLHMHTWNDSVGPGDDEQAVFNGLVSMDAQACISWEDGDHWIKK